MRNYISNPPKTHSERIEFVQTNAPRLVAGIIMLEKYLEDLKNKSVSSIRPKNKTEKLGIKEHVRASN